MDEIETPKEQINQTRTIETEGKPYFQVFDPRFWITEKTYPNIY